MNIRSPQHPRIQAMSLVEILVAVGIIVILSGIMIPGVRQVKKTTSRTVHVNNVKGFTSVTLKYAGEHNNRLPSPQYPNPTSPDAPPHAAFASDSGLWLDGVVFYEVMYAKRNEKAEESGNPAAPTVDSISGGANGSHLKGTVFFSQRSLQKTPAAERENDDGQINYHLHSYAMNKSLQHDSIAELAGGDPELSEKNLSKLLPTGLLYIENEQSNVIGIQDLDAIIETGKKRWDDGVIAAFLDSSVEVLKFKDIPDPGSTSTDRVASRFWHGVDPDNR